MFVPTTEREMSTDPDHKKLDAERVMTEAEFDDWHYCAGGCGAKHFDHDEPHRCACGRVCPGVGAPQRSTAQL